MKCETIFSQLSSYVDDELDGKGLLEIKQHLQSCENCQKQLHEIKNVKRLLTDISAPQVSASFEKNLLQRTKKLEKKQYFQWSLSIAASFLLVVSLVNILDTNSPNNSSDKEFSKNHRPVDIKLSIEEFNKSTQFTNTTLVLECDDVSVGGACIMKGIDRQS
jgi:predicted anti-sigma-YlaC factor YlaD